MSRPVLRNVCWIALLFAAVVFVLYGYGRGEWSIVLKKAVSICFQCIGLG